MYIYLLQIFGTRVDFLIFKHGINMIIIIKNLKKNYYIIVLKVDALFFNHLIISLIILSKLLEFF